MSIPRKKNVTAKDIANACGISQATVSYVINNKEGKKISDATRQLVLETARQLNYVPNSTARSMRTSRSMSIGIVSGRNNLSLGFSHVLRGVKEYLDSVGYSITLLNDDSGDIDQHEYVRYYRSSRIDGILFLFYEMEDSTMKMLEEEHSFLFSGRKRCLAQCRTTSHIAGRRHFTGGGAVPAKTIAANPFLFPTAWGSSFLEKMEPVFFCISQRISGSRIKEIYFSNRRHSGAGIAR